MTTAVASPFSTPPQITDAALAEEIRQRMNDRSLAGFDRRRQIAGLILDALSNRGRFCRTQDGRLFLFATAERRLYDIRREEFDRLVAALSGLSLTEMPFKFTKDQLVTQVSRTAPVVPVHTFAAYDTASGRIILSDGGPSVWARSERGEWDARASRRTRRFPARAPPVRRAGRRCGAWRVCMACDCGADIVHPVEPPSCEQLDCG